MSLRIIAMAQTDMDHAIVTTPNESRSSVPTFNAIHAGRPNTATIAMPILATNFIVPTFDFGNLDV